MLSEEDWESLCNQCGNCCHLMLADGSRSLKETCTLLDKQSNTCIYYSDRHNKKLEIYRGTRNCIPLVEKDLAKYYESKFLPEDCAYIKYYLETYENNKN